MTRFLLLSHNCGFALIVGDDAAYKTHLPPLLRDVIA
jgi:hypothetical protein